MPIYYYNDNDFLSSSKWSSLRISVGSFESAFFLMDMLIFDLFISFSMFVMDDDHRASGNLIIYLIKSFSENGTYNYYEKIIMIQTYYAFFLNYHIFNL